MEKNKRILSEMWHLRCLRCNVERILAVPPEILHTKRDELALLSFPFNHQNQLDKPSLIYCVTWLCKLSPCPMTCFAESKLVNVTNYNPKLSKWTEDFYIVMRIFFLKCLLDLWKAKIVVAPVFQPWFFFWNAGVRTDLDLPRIWTTLNRFGPPLTDLDPPYQTFLLSIMCIQAVCALRLRCIVVASFLKWRLKP